MFRANRSGVSRVACALAAMTLVPLFPMPGLTAASPENPAVAADGEARQQLVQADPSPVPSRLELLLALLQNELEADWRRLEQLAAERSKLVQQRDVLLADDARTEARVNEIQARLQRVDQEMALLQTRIPAVEADLADAERRLRGVDATTQYSDDQRRVQEALVYLGGYDGRIDGQFGRRTQAAIRAFQRRLGDEPSGTLTDEQQTALLEQAEALRQQHGVQTLRDQKDGYSFVYPRELLPVEQLTTSGERRFASPTGDSELQIEVSEQASDLRLVFADLLTRYDAGYSSLQEDWFVISRTDRDEVFYEMALRSDERLIRVRLIYPTTQREIWQPFTVILLNSLRFGASTIVEEAQ